MPTIHILKARAKPSFQSFEFDTYNEAEQFAQRSAKLSPSKPYKRLQGAAMPVWCVTIRQTRKDRAVYVKFDSVPGYLGWKLAA